MKPLIFVMILAHRIVKFAIPKLVIFTNKIKFIQRLKQEKGRRVATQSCICSFNLYIFRIKNNIIYRFAIYIRGTIHLKCAIYESLSYIKYLYKSYIIQT